MLGEESKRAASDDDEEEHDEDDEEENEEPNPDEAVDRGQFRNILENICGFHKENEEYRRFMGFLKAVKMKHFIFYNTFHQITYDYIYRKQRENRVRNGNRVNLQ